MKRNVLLIVALLLVSVHISAVAEENPVNAGLAVVAKGPDLFKVIYKNERAVSKIRMNIYNSSSNLIYTEVVSGDGFIRPLRFSGLLPGEYTVEISDGVNKRSEKIVYRPAAAASKKAVHVSKIAGEEKYLVSVANASGEKFTINIYDEFDRLVHTETRLIADEFAQVYNVKNKKVSSVEIIDQAGNKKVSRF
jgi:hypothetical protein